MEEADVLATRAAIMAKRLLTIGTSQALRNKYSSLYHISLILRSAPSSSIEEMRAVQSFVENNVPRAKLDRDMLGGQVRFTIPVATSQASPTVDGQMVGDRKPDVVTLINLLEENKVQLGVECYSVEAATLENVFLSVMKANNVQEDEAEAADQRFRRPVKRFFCLC